MALSKLLGPPGRSAGFSAVIDSSFYLWGGRVGKNNDTLLQSLFHFDFNKEEWRSEYLHGLIPPGYRHGACATDGHSLYIYGGDDKEGSSTSSLFEIDIKECLFKELSTIRERTTKLPQKKNDCGMVVYKGKVIIFGGKNYILEDFNQRTNEIHAYDIETGNWSTPVMTGDIPPPCSNFSFSRLNEDTVVMFGGHLGHDNCRNEIHILNLAKMNWKWIPHKHSDTWPSQRRAHSASVLGYGTEYAEIIIIGGKVDVENFVDIWKLNPRNWKWEMLSLSGHIILNRRWHMSGTRQISPFLCEVILFGGYRHRSVIQDTALLVFEYDRWEKTWIIKEIVEPNVVGSSERIIKKNVLQKYDQPGAHVTSKSYHFYMDLIPEANRPKLRNKIVSDDHIHRLAAEMIGWEEKSHLFYLQDADVNDIKSGQYKNNPACQRIEVLQMWRKRTPEPSYGSLLHIFVNANFSCCADEIITIFKEE